MKKLFSMISIMVVMMLMFTACSSSQDSTKSQVKKQDLIMGTGGTAGTYYIVGVAMGDTVSKKSSVNNVVVQSSLGSIENINLTNLNQMQLGFSNADGIYFGYNGTGSYAKTGKQNILGVMSLYKSAGQMVTKASSGIKTYADLKGKKVVLGPPSTTIVEMSKAILREYGIDPETDIKPYYLSFDEGLTKVVDGEVDASFMVSGAPTAAIMNATATTKMALVDVDPAIAQKISKDQPYYEPYVIPANTYKGIDYPVNTLKIMTTIFTNSKVSEQAIYDFVKSSLENVAVYQNSHEVVKEITPESASKMSIPLHPGAEKYYKEKGLIK